MTPQERRDQELAARVSFALYQPGTGPGPHQERDYIVTASGERFYPLSPRVADVRLYDIAHALSHMPRFTGHTKHFYSVAQHSVRVALAVPLEFRLEALLHDASEAYLCDIATPIKHSPIMAGYREAERRLQDVIHERFGLVPGLKSKEVALADARMCRTEIRDLMDEEEFEGTPIMDYEPLEKIGLVWAPEVARSAFIRQYTLLTLKTESGEVAA